MDRHGTNIKKLLLGIILVVLLLPLLQQHLNLIESQPLQGAQVPAERVWFSMNAWMNGNYQEGYEKWHGENIGFRADLVRVHNQIEYSLYNKASAQQVVIGKDGYLYEENYLRSYAGLDYLGKPKIEATVNRIRQLQDSMETKGITLVVCLAAGKASFYPEYMPDEYKGSDSTNYKVYASLLKQKNVNFIDYNSWFMSMKGKTEFPLYPRTGIHWSRYGSLMVVDSFIRYVEHKRGVDMPNVVWDYTVWSDSLQSPDDDIGSAMNLIWPLPAFRMGYPVYHFESREGKAKVRLMTLSDSFFWSMFDIGLAPSAFENIEFYYYNNEIHHSTGAPMTNANVLMGIEEAERSDVVMMMATEATLWGLGWGFIDDAFNHFVLHKAVDNEDALVQKYEALIRTDEKWMEDIREKANSEGISVDSMIYIDARYMAKEEMKNQQQ